MEAKYRESSHWWWLDSQNKGNASRSAWLHSTLTELDEKTTTMLKIIEEDADSFARRAEMYYKKRPELISMVEDFYRSHRSLAERFDQMKLEHTTRLPSSSPWSSPMPFTKYHLQKSLSLTPSVKTYDTYSESYGPEEECDESEVDDPEVFEEVTQQEHLNLSIQNENENKNANAELVSLKEEVEKLRETNKVQEEQLLQKDEEKREVIRQLSLAMELLREENKKLRQSLLATNNNTPKKEDRPNNTKSTFLGRLFTGFSNPVIAL